MRPRFKSGRAHHRKVVYTRIGKLNGFIDTLYNINLMDSPLKINYGDFYRFAFMLQSIESKIYNICNEVFCNINDRRVIHQLLQTKIYQLAQDFNYKAWREFRIPNVRDDGRDGLIDVVWFKVMKPFIAFEIDSSFRSKSIKKLLAISAPYKFWIYYGHENRESLTPKEINLIYAHRYKRKSCRKCL